VSAVTQTQQAIGAAARAVATATPRRPRVASGITKATIVGGLTSAGVLVGSLAIVVGLWEWASRAFGIPFLFPGPLAVADAFVENAADGTLAASTGASLVRIAAGFLIGTVGGVVLGLVLGASRIAVGLAAPFVTFFRFVPPLAWFAPVLLWFGAGEASKIVLIVYTSLFVVALNTLEGSSKIPHDLTRMAGVAGATWWQRMLWVTLPASVPFIFAGARVAMGNAFMTVVSAEMLGASAGLGVMVNNGMITANIPDVFTAILMLGTLGLLCDRLFVLAMNKLGRRFRGQQTVDVA
jgi:ABC-type nitrate/sulfonate/bicarbonate transport system permease component